MQEGLRNFTRYTLLYYLKTKLLNDLSQLHCDSESLTGLFKGGTV